MDISIIIVNWNTRNYLGDCISSLPEGVGAFSFETFVVDNGSRDGSPEMVGREFPAVQLIANRANRGFAAANNQALRLAKGRYVLLLNPDTRVHKGSLEKMVKFMDEHVEAAACGPLLLNEDGTAQHAARRFPTFAYALASKTVFGRLGLFRGSHDFVRMRGVSFDHTIEVDQPSGAALFIRRDSLEKIGLLDEGYFIFFEEVDLCHRLKDAGYRIYLCPEARVTHYGGRSRRQNRTQVTLANAESMLRYFRKHEGRLRGALFELLFRPLFALDILADVFTGIFKVSTYKLRRRDAKKLKARRDVLSSRIQFLKRDLVKFLTSIWE
jgi:GT2 family glycosyltransferase